MSASVQMICETCGAPAVEGAHGQYMVIGHNCADYQAAKLRVVAIELSPERDRLVKEVAKLQRERDEATAALAAFDPACGVSVGSARLLVAERDHYRARAAEMHVRAQFAEACVEKLARAGLAECERLRAYEHAFKVAMDRAERAERDLETMSPTTPVPTE